MLQILQCASEPCVVDSTYIRFKIVEVFTIKSDWEMQRLMMIGKIVSDFMRIIIIKENKKYLNVRKLKKIFELFRVL